MNIHTYSFYPIDSKMYIILENKKALIIDPCVSEEAWQLIKDYSVSEILVLLTHEHYDHISGVNWLRENFSHVCVLCSSECAKALPNPSKNLSNFWEVLFVGKDEETQEYVRNMDIQPYSCEADESFSDEQTIEWEGHTLYLKETPGHSKGSICIEMDGKVLFSGDTLVTGYPTITRLPGGSKKEFKGTTLSYLRSLNPEFMVYPGHGEKQPLKMFWEGENNGIFS